MRCSKYYFNHLMFYFQPEVFIFPIALWIDKTGIQISTLWFNVVWYWEKQTNEIEAAWQYWDGWCGNHDKRIDDATCSKCGYKHPIVRGTPELLADYCAGCGAKMIKG